MAAVTVKEVRSFEPAYRLFRAQLHCHMTRVLAVNTMKLALFIVDHGDTLPLTWGAQNRHNLTPSPQEYELFLRQQYLKTAEKAQC